MKGNCLNFKNMACKNIKLQAFGYQRGPKWVSIYLLIPVVVQIVQIVFKQIRNQVMNLAGVKWSLGQKGQIVTLYSLEYNCSLFYWNKQVSLGQICGGVTGFPICFSLSVLVVTGIKCSKNGKILFHLVFSTRKMDNQLKPTYFINYN